MSIETVKSDVLVASGILKLEGVSEVTITTSEIAYQTRNEYINKHDIIVDRRKTTC